MLSRFNRSFFCRTSIHCKPFSSNPHPSQHFTSKYRRFFSDGRTLGFLALLVSFPTAAYIWKKYTKDDSSDSKKTSKIMRANENHLSSSSIDGPIKKIKYLIIGGGAAGFSAIQAILENDSNSNSQILLVSKEASVPYLRPPLSKELWFSPKLSEEMQKEPSEISFTDWHGENKSLSLESEQYFKDNRVQLILGRDLVAIDVDNKQVDLSDGQKIEFERLLLATGADPKRLEIMIPENLQSNLTTFRGIKDFKKLYSLLSENSSKRIVVVGGGFLGSELTVAMAHVGVPNGHSITQIFPEKGHMGLVFPKYLSQWTTDKVSNMGVNVKSGRYVKEINSAEGGALGLVLDNNELIIADHVVVAVGVDPSLNFKHTLPVDLSNSGLQADSHFLVAPGIFAAGDVVSYLDPILKIRRRTEHFDHAILSGKLAGKNMTLSEDKFESYSNLSMFWSDLGPDVGYEAVGLIDSSLTTVGVWAQAFPVDSPKNTDFDPSDIRVASIGQTSINSVEPKRDILASSYGFKSDENDTQEPSIQSSDTEQPVPSYGKGVVFYLKERKIVGILLFNLFNRVSLAKEIIKDGKDVDDINKCVRLFNIYDKV